MEWYYWLLAWWLIGLVALIISYIKDTGGEPFTVGDIFFVAFTAFAGCFIVLVFLYISCRESEWDEKLDKALKRFLAIEIYTPKKGKK